MSYGNLEPYQHSFQKLTQHTPNAILQCQRSPGHFVLNECQVDEGLDKGVHQVRFLAKTREKGAIDRICVLNDQVKCAHKPCVSEI